MKIDDVDVNEEIKRISFLSNKLEKESRLCSSIGKQIVAEFKFKGDKKSIETQLLNLINLLQNNFTNKQKEFIIQCRENLLKYLKNKEFNAYDKEIEHNITINIEKAENIRKTKEISNNIIHEKKECICYNN